MPPEPADALRRGHAALLAGELGVFEWDVQQDRLYGDEHFHRLLGLPERAAGGATLETYLALIHPQDRQATAALLARAVQSGEKVECDYRVCLPGGERWLNSRGRVLRTGDGGIGRFHGVVLDITDRKRAERARETMTQELRRLSAVHQTVLSAIDDFAYIFDREGRFLYANRRLLTVWGRTLDQVIGRTCYDLGYPTWHADMHMREIAQVIATRQSIRGEVPFTGGSGISGVYDYIFTPVFGADGEVEFIAGTTRDVTERRRTEDRDRFLVALDDATRPLTDAEEMTQVCAQLLGDHLRVNRCAYADVEADQDTFNLTGNYTRGVPSIVGRYRFADFGPDCLRQMREGSAFVVEDSRVDPRTAPVRASYEATMIRSVVCVPLRKGGQLVAAMAVHQKSVRCWQPHEIELVLLVANRCWESIERMRVVRALAHNEQQLQLAINTARLGVWEWDLTSQSLVCSEQCKRIYGRPAQETFALEEFHAAVHPDDRARVQQAIEHAVAQKGEFETEYQTAGFDGAAHWVLVRGRPTYTAEGVPKSLIGVSLDITARKQAERELQRLHEEALRASRAKDDFLAALSHELRTPLNPVLLLASEAAHDPTLPATARESFVIIRKNIELEARLIDDLLDLTSIVRGKVMVRKQRVDLHALLEEAVAAMRGDIAEKQLRLTLQLGAPAPFIEADRVRLLQVVLNLVRNAVKFTADGGRIRLSTQRVVGAAVELRVADTGIGMTAAEMQRAFGAFEQGDHAAAPGVSRFGGLGLGLAIARQLVELHSGTIRAESEGRDRGAVVIVRLPLAPAVVSGSSPAPPSAQAPRDHRGAGRRLLLIEDHDATRRILHQLLLRRGYVVAATASVQEALAAVQHQVFDLVVSDIGLPDGDGAVLMHRLREEHGLRGIALTGYGMPEDVLRCQAAGFLEHLPKPVSVEALDAALQRLVPARGAAGQPG